MNTNRIAFIGLWVFVFSMPWERAVSIPGVGAAGTLFGVAAFVLGLYTVVRGDRLRARAPSLFLIVFALYIFWLGISFFWAITEKGARLRFVTFAQFLAMSWLVWELCRTPKRYLALLQAYILGAFVVVTTIVYGFITNPFVPNSESDLFRYTGINDNPNFLATVVAVGLAIAWYLVVKYERGLRYWLYLAYLPLAVMSLGLLASRSGLLIGLVSLSLIPLTYGYLSTARKVIFALLIGAGSVVAVSAIPASNIERLSTTTEQITTGNVSNREQIWEAGLEAFQRSPLIGVGAGSYGDAVEQVRGFDNPSHNAYIAVLVELGLVGLVLFLVMLIVPILPAFRLPYKERVFHLVLWLAILVAFLPNNWETHKSPWFLLTLFSTQGAYIVLPSSLFSWRKRQNAPARGGLKPDRTKRLTHE